MDKFYVTLQGKEKARSPPRIEECVVKGYVCSLPLAYEGVKHHLPREAKDDGTIE